MVAAEENMFLAVASVGLEMAWLSGFAEEHMGNKLRRLLKKVLTPVRLMAGLPIGYPQAASQTRSRRPLHMRDYVQLPVELEKILSPKEQKAQARITFRRTATMGKETT